MEKLARCLPSNNFSKELYYKMISKGIINSLNENFKGYNIDTYNIYTLDNDNRYYYAIDSTKHILIKVKRCT